MNRRIFVLSLLAIWFCQTPARAQDAKVDAIFAKWTDSTPGCAVGVSAEGRIVVERAYGMADLEHDAKNSPGTIFEAGSVSKQFTAAAILLLAKDGKLSLDDPVSKYIRELPEYGQPLLIRHMLNHTSGLRDWGSVESIAGEPRGSRTYTHAHVLDIVSHQLHLNFPSGTRWSYSNTGYNLGAIIVSRVSGQSFAEFSRERIFEPLGMAKTSWRDDFTRIVKGRAIAYREEQGTFHMEMPFENVHGNGGLLTTVGDLLRWNENFVEPKVGDTNTIRLQQTPGKLNDGTQLDYAFGLFVQQYKGVREVSHSGATAGYRAFLTRFPDQNVGVAVLCNISSGAPEQYAHAVADIYLGNRLKPAPTPDVKPVALGIADLDARTGVYRNTETGAALVVARDKETLRIQIDAVRPALTALSASRFDLRDGRTLEFGSAGDAKLSLGNGTFETCLPLCGSYERVQPANPTHADLKSYMGMYTSDEAEVTFSVTVQNNRLEIHRRPDAVIGLTPIYKDGFNSSLGFIRFHRDRSGQVNELSVTESRVWNLRFKKK